MCSVAYLDDPHVSASDLLIPFASCPPDREYNHVRFMYGPCTFRYFRRIFVSTC